LMENEKPLSSKFEQKWRTQKVVDKVIDDSLKDKLPFLILARHWQSNKI
jgi:hypothetical protein